MSKLLKVSLTLVLVLAMLFSVLGVTVFAASGEGATTDAAEGIAAAAADDATVEELLDGWINVEYTSDGILITITPDRQDLPSKSSINVKEIMNVMITAAKEVALDELIEKIMGGGEGDMTTTVLRNTFDLFLEEYYGVTDADRTTYIAFAEDALANDDAVNALADYVCDLMELAIIAGVMEIDSFPASDDFRGEISAIFSDYTSNVINTAINEHVDAYKAYKTDTTGEVEAPELAVLIDEFVDGYIIDYVCDTYGIPAEYAEAYLEANPLTPADYELFFASEAYNEYNIKHTLANDTDLIDQSMLLLYGLTMADVEARVGEIDGIVSDKYEVLYTAYAGKTLGLEDYAKLLNYLNYIKVDDVIVYGTVSDKGQTFVLDAVQELLKKIPTFAEIAEMDDDEMQVSYDVAISTFLGESSFSVTVKLAGEQANVKKIAKIIADNVKISYDGSTLDLDVNVPDELAKAILKLAKSDKISASLKNKVFSMFEENADGVIALVNDVEFETLLELLDKVDLTGVLDSSFVARFEKLDGLTVDEIKEKIAKYENLYNKAIKALNKIYSYVPAELKTKTLSEIYEGDGVFAAGGSVTVDVLDVIAKANEKLESDKLEQIGDLIDGFLDKTEVSVTANVSIKLNDIYQITYYKGSELHSVGFLPAGADVTFFANVTEYNGQLIVGWVDAVGTPVTEMPAEDTVLYAKVEDIEATLTVNGEESLEKIYDGEAATLVATVTPEYPAPYTYTYEWYREGVLVAGANANTLAVKNVADSGSYYCIITEYYKGDLVDSYATNSVEVVIEKATVSLEDNVTFAGGEYVYNKNAQGVTYTVSGAIKDLVSVIGEEQLSAILAGNYTAEVSFALTDSANYKFDGASKVSYDWSIDKATLTKADVTLKDVSPFTYSEGVVNSVALADFIASKHEALNVSLSTESVLSAVACGKYNVFIIVDLADNANYKWGDDNNVIVATWTVAAKVIDLSSFGWQSLAGTSVFNFIYNGEEQGVILSGNIPAEILDALVYVNNKTVNVLDGTQIATVSIDPAKLAALEANYAFVRVNGEIAYPAGCRWTISPEIIDVEGLIVKDSEGNALVGGEGEYAEYQYNPNGQSVIASIENADVNVTPVIYYYRGTRSAEWVKVSEIKNAGTYKVVLEFDHKTDTHGNYDINTGDYELEYTIVITPIDITTDFAWVYGGGYVYTPGQTFSVVFNSTLDAEILALFNVTFSGISSSAVAGDYTAFATVELIDKVNYVFITANGTSALGIETYRCDWSVEKRAITPEFVWVGTAGLVYNREFQTIDFVGNSMDLFEIVFSGDELSQKNASTYTAVAAVELIDKANYTYYVDGTLVEDGAYTYDVIWTIAKKQVNVSVSWSGSAVNTYNGNSFRVRFRLNADDANVVISETSGTLSEKNVGSYTASAIVSLVDTNNYEMLINNAAGDNIVTTEPQHYDYSWQIIAREIDLGFYFVGEESYVYDGNEKIIDAMFDETYIDQFDVVYNGTKSATVVGDYTYTVSFTLRDTANNIFIVDGEEFDGTKTYTFNWKITKCVIELPTFTGFGGSILEFVYDGNKKTVAFNNAGIDRTYFNITLTGNSAKDVNLDGEGNVIPYVASAIIALKDTHNYVLANGETEILHSVEWTINKRVIDISGLKWTDANGKEWVNPVYNGSKHTAPTILAGADVTSYVLLRFEVKDATGKTVTNFTNAGNYVSYVTWVVDQNNIDLITDDGAGNAIATSFEWQITPASLLDYIIANGITMGGRTDGTGSKIVTIDGTAKNVPIEGTLPAGVTVEYTVTDLNGNEYDAAIKVGSYIITATFTSTNSNYAENATMTAKLHIVADGNSEYTSEDGTVWVKVTELLEFGHSINADKVNLDAVDSEALAQAITRYINDGKDYNAQLLYARDIYFMFEGSQVDINNIFTVRMTLPEGIKAAKGEKLLVVYISDDGQTFEVFESSELENNTVQFDTEHFSIYGIVKATVAAPEASGDTEIDSDESGIVLATVAGIETTDLWWIWIIVAVLAVIIIILLIVLIKKRKDTDDEDDGDEPEIEPEPEAEEAAPVVEETVTEEPAEELVVVEEPVEELVVVEEPVEEIVVVEEPTEEIVVVEEPVVEEVVVVEEPAPVVEEPVAEEPAANSYAAIFAASEGADAVRLVNGVVVPVRYRTSFMSRLIQSEPPIQDYYTAVKNYLLSFKGVKARTSWNFESFNKGRIQCAKLNVKGSAFQVYLGLDPNEYSEDKYHFVNVGDKPKLDKVPLMMKVKSDRSLKYTFELIDEVMSKNGIERGDLPEVDYHMPYESTEALVDKDLVKVILPDGMQIDENTIIEKVNVGALLKDVKPAEETVEEAPVVEEAAVEAPVAEEPVIEEVAVEEPAPIQIVDHQVAEEQIAFVDAVEADQIISDEQAAELIETVARETSLKPKTNKCYEVNLDTICEAFEDGETVDLKALKARGIIAKKADRVKILARGTMTKKVTVVADKFSIQAVKMIGLAGGLAQKYKD